jgi:hypothetical protein
MINICYHVATYMDCKGWTREGSRLARLHSQPSFEADEIPGHRSGNTQYRTPLLETSDVTEMFPYTACFGLQYGVVSLTKGR